MPDFINKSTCANTRDSLFSIMGYRVQMEMSPHLLLRRFHSGTIRLMCVYARMTAGIVCAADEIVNKCYRTPIICCYRARCSSNITRKKRKTIARKGVTF